MSRFKPRLYDDFADALANFALTFAKAMLVVGVVLMVMISPPKKADEGVKPKVDFMITLDWPPGDNDVDVWMSEPGGRIMYYSNKEAGSLNLERDDMGNINNTAVVNGETRINDVHQEVVSIRGIVPGEYIVNAHLYRSGEHADPDWVLPHPVEVKVHILRLNPTVSEVWKGAVLLKVTKEEVHVVRFRLEEDKRATDFNSSLPVNLIEKIGTKPK